MSIQQSSVINKNKLSNQHKSRSFVIKSILNRYSSIFSYIIILLCVLLKFPNIISVPYLWAEDARIFMQRAIDYGYKSIFMVYAGYYHFFTQFFTYLWVQVCSFLGTFVPLPYFMQYTAHITNSLFLFFFVTSRFDWLIANKYNRLLCITLTILLLPQNTSEVWGSITQFQWWATFFVFLSGLDILHDKEKLLPEYKYFLILLIISFSSPCVVFVLGIIVLKILLYIIHNNNYISIQRISKHDCIKLLLIIIAFIIQINSIFRTRTPSLNAGTLNRKLELAIEGYFRFCGLLFQPWRVYPFVFRGIFSGLVLSVVFGVIIWEINIFCTKEFRLVSLYGLIFSLSFWLLCCVSFRDIDWFDMYIRGQGGGRYGFNIHITLIFVSLIRVLGFLYRISKTQKICALCCLIYFFLLSFGGVGLMSNEEVGKTEYWIKYSNLFTSIGNELMFTPTPLGFVRIPISFEKIQLNKGNIDVVIISNEITQQFINNSFIYRNALIDQDTLRISGWFYSVDYEIYLEKVLVKVENTYYPCDTFLYDENNMTKKTGFYVDIPCSSFKNSSVLLTFYGLDNNNSEYFEKTVIFPYVES
ncbi:MAG: hypothetical protein FWG88_10395 [Oscillospiraceae bacterium]|nr:hypothetical protein [Oscillospiraceae bacterium]